MRTADLHLGEQVFVRLPYEGGQGWARVVEVGATPPAHFPSYTVAVEFLPGSGPMYGRTRLVAPVAIVRAREAGEVIA